jgi:excinuclease UvrABC nuclease subunit
LGILKNIFKELPPHTDFIALGKGAARERKGKNKWEKEKIYSFGPDGTIRSRSLQYDQADKILIQLRNEAHRFANAYRKKQMSKEWK